MNCCRFGVTGLICIVLLLAYGSAPADPVVHSIEGYWSTGETLTVLGESFGPEAEILILDDFERGIDGEPIVGSDPVVGPAWVSMSPQFSLNPRFSSENRYSGQQAARLFIDYETAVPGFGCRFEERYDEIYCSFRRFQPGQSAGILEYESVARLWLGDLPLSPHYMSFSHIGYGDTYRGFIRNYQTGETAAGYFHPEYPYDTWNRWEIYYRTTSPELIDWEVTVDGNRHIEFQQFPIGYNELGGGWAINSLFLGGPAHGLNGEPFPVYLDDIYLARGRARIEIGDHPDYEACWRREIIVPVEWSEGAIRFQPLDYDVAESEYYLFVIDAEGQRSIGVPIPVEPPVLPPLPLLIDVKPGSEINPVNLTGDRGVIPVAIMERTGFVSPRHIIPTTVRFGPGEAADISTHGRGPGVRWEDVDGDGLSDLVFHFRVGDSGILPGATKVELRAATIWGRDALGSDRITTKGKPDGNGKPGHRISVAPNPFNPMTRVMLDLAGGQEVRLQVFDVRGRLVADVARGYYGAGAHSFDWNGTDLTGKAAPSGVYFFRAELVEGAVSVRAQLVR